jgi:hypothetical protein
MNFETYYLHQFNHSPFVTTLNAVGIQFDFYFELKQMK